ncbi:hypothetical protein HMPREF1624_00498 [Sporothrix schenckii ATCC 58251]|uniref:DUF2415 domain-containing protein n=1 Tax=Sporothrix schenckii (strain ATCC 58251 / de Perez 2211183) TaxID=1391915 RepID=U7Q595_SPOS1|nr:hypothetical protein HMPREF1624_00498 [Sporothrix schenckii ATCC 58251]
MPGADDERGPESLLTADDMASPPTPSAEAVPTGEPLLNEFEQMTVENGGIAEGSAAAGVAAGDATGDPDAGLVHTVPDEGQEGSTTTIPLNTIEVAFINSLAALPMIDWSHVPPIPYILDPVVSSTTGSALEPWSPFSVNYGPTSPSADLSFATPATQQQHHPEYQQTLGDMADAAADQPSTQPALVPGTVPPPPGMMQDFHFANDSFSSFFFAPYTPEEPPHYENTHTGPEAPPLPLPIPSYYNVTVPYGNGYAVHHAVHNPAPSTSPNPPPTSNDDDVIPAPNAEPATEFNLEQNALSGPPVPAAAGHGAFTDANFGVELPVGMTLPVTFTTTAGLPMNIELSPTNPDLKRFLVNWQACTRVNVRGIQTSRGPVPTVVPSPTGTEHLFHTEVHEVRASDLKGDHCDYQGIKWAAMGITRNEARAFRQRRYLNYCANNQDAWIPDTTEVMPQNTETYFRFCKMKMRKAPYLAHFQLRNLLAAPSKSRVFYADRRSIVRQYNFATNKTAIALRYPSDTYIQISTIAAEQGVLVSGGFNGEYCTKNIDSEYAGESNSGAGGSGTFSNLGSGISNHIQIHSARRSGGPVAALSSNDSHLRVMDLATQSILSDDFFSFPVNCTAVSPDRRMRVVVGDSNDAYIVAAEQQRHMKDANGTSKPDVLQKLEGHADFGFACAWADDGYTIATGNQDRAIKIWDARKTSTASGVWTPIGTLRTTMAGVRSLHFSPAGSGKRVLVAAEEADILHIIDAQTFDKRQAFDVFGELAGLSFSENGQDLFTLCTDPTRGGILHFQRDGVLSAASTFDETPIAILPGISDFDWPDRRGRPYQQRSRGIRRRLRAAAVSSMNQF